MIMLRDSDGQKAPFLNDDLELGVGLNNGKQVQDVNLFVRTRSTFSFILHYVKTLLENFTELFTAKEQSNSYVSEDDEIDRAFKKVFWRDLEGKLCYPILSFPERIQYAISWFTTLESIASLVKWKLLFSDYPVVRAVFASVKLGAVGVCTLLDAIRCTGWAKSWLPVVPGHYYHRLSIMNTWASALCVEDVLYFLSIRETPVVRAAGIISGCFLLINLTISGKRSVSPSIKELRELRQFLTSPIAKQLPANVYDYMYEEAYRNRGTVIENLLSNTPSIPNNTPPPANTKSPKSTNKTSKSTA